MQQMDLCMTSSIITLVCAQHLAKHLYEAIAAVPQHRTAVL